MPTYIALDTSAIEAEAYDFSGSPALAGLTKAVKDGDASVLIVDVVDREVRKHLPVHARKASHHIKKALEELKEAHLAHGAGAVDLEKIEKILGAVSKDDIAQKLEAQWATFIRDARVTTLKVGDVDPAAVFSKYFAEKPPFSSKKPKEFPDAFQIERLQGWAAAQGEVLHVVATDPDFAAACDGTKLIHVPRIGAAVSIAIASSTAAKSRLRDDIMGFIAGQADRIKEVLTEHIEGVDVAIEDDWDADVAGVAVESIENLRFDVIELRDGSAQVEGYADVTVQVEASVGDYDNSPVDGGEYVMVYQNTVAIKAKRDVRFDISVRLRRRQGKPTAVSASDPVLTEPKVFKVGMNEDETKVLRSWSDDDDRAEAE